jgi:coatomer subunit beta
MQEGDAACKRNAFIMLYNCAQPKALEYLNTVLDQVPSFGDILQFVTIELLRKVHRTNISAGERVCSLSKLASLLLVVCRC